MFKVKQIKMVYGYTHTMEGNQVEKKNKNQKNKKTGKTSKVDRSFGPIYDEYLV